LCSRLEHDYDLILRNVPLYSRRHRPVGEIDILAIKGDEYDIYEVKCSNRIIKAKHQLNKIRRILSNTSKVNQAFFFCGESGRLQIM